MRASTRHKFWEKSINRKYINRLLMHAKHAIWHVPEKRYILYVHISHIDSLVSIDTSAWGLKTFPGIFLSKFHFIGCIEYISARVLWHFITRSYKCKEDPLMGSSLHLYDNVIKCHNTRADMYSIHPMNWNLDKNIPGNVFNPHADVSIDTKMSMWEIWTYDI